MKRHVFTPPRSTHPFKDMQQCLEELILKLWVPNYPRRFSIKGTQKRQHILVKRTNNNCYWTHTSLVVFTLNFKTSNSLTTLLSSFFNLRRWTLHLLDTFYWGSLCEGVYKFFYRLVSTMDPPKVFWLRKILLIRGNIERLFFTLPCFFGTHFLQVEFDQHIEIWS